MAEVEEKKKTGSVDEEKSNKTSSSNINDWLPVTSSRNAKWYYSAFIIVAAMVGSGVLALPYAISDQLGWGAAVTALILAWVITLYTLWQMIQMPGKRLDRYHELGQEASGQKLQKFLVQWVDIVCMVICGKFLHKIYETACPDCHPLTTTYFILMFGSVRFFLSFYLDFNSISLIYLHAAVLSLGYSIIGWEAARKGIALEVDYAGGVFGFLSAL